MKEKEIEFILDENSIKSMTADFIKNFKSRIDDKSINNSGYFDDITEAYACGVHNGCMLILNKLKESLREDV